MTGRRVVYQRRRRVGVDVAKRADEIQSTAVGRMARKYFELVRAIFLEEPVAELLDELMTFFARSLVVADLAARADIIDGDVAPAAAEAGIELSYDPPEMISIPSTIQFQEGREFSRIMGQPLEEIAGAFADAVPDISQRILDVAASSQSAARIVWAEESVKILEFLTPSLNRALTDINQALPDGTQEVGLRDFFTSAEHRLRRTQFEDITRRRLENIYRTNLSTAVNRAAWETKNQEPLLRMTPFYEYSAIDDQRVRPAHWAFDGFIAPTDWYGWAYIWPPNGYQCRCATPLSIFRAEARRRGLIDEQGRPVESRYKQTWRRAISAGLLTDAGVLTGTEVTMTDRQGRQVTESFPQEGFAGTSTGV